MTRTPAANTTHTTLTGELHFYAPAELILDDNIRDEAEATITPEFVRSIAEHGILQPLLGVQTSDGIKIRDGQRRTLGAIKAGLDLAPVYVITADTNADAAADTLHRISEQWITAAQRAPLTAAQKVNAVEQLTLAGISPAKITKALKAKRAEIDAAVAVTKATNTRDTIAHHDLTLEQAAILASWDDDPVVQNELIAALDTGQFDHVARRWDDDRAERAAITEATAELVNDGYEVLAQRPHYTDTRIDLARLLTADGKRAVTVDGLLEGLPHDKVAAYVYIDEVEETFWNGDEQISDHDIDWSLDDLDDDDPATPVDGKHDPRRLTTRPIYRTEIDWYITDHADLGLFTHNELPSRSETPTSTDPAHASVDADPAAAQAARVAAAEQARVDAEAERKHEQRQVRTLNKMGLAAQKVRRDKVSAVLSRKTLPKGKAAAVAEFVATTMWKHHTLLAQCAQDANAHTLTTELLNADPLEELDNASAERRHVITLAIAIGAHEANLPKDAWRTKPYEYSSGDRNARTLYLRFLTDVFGYTLADIEQVVTGDRAADTISLD